MKLSRRQGRPVKVLIAAVVVWALYRLIYPRYDWHQKLTVVVETPTGEVSGSSVVASTVIVYPKILPEQSPVSNTWRGEASVVDLGNQRYLFALLGNPIYLARSAYRPQTPDGPKQVSGQTVYRKLDSWFGKPDPAILTPANYPLLVTFDDITDPASVKRVDPFDMDGALGLCPDGSGLKNEDAPWRAENMLWREWARFKASGVSSLGEYRTAHFDATQKEAMEAAIVPRDTSTDCHRLQSITLEITSEAVTEGRVEEVLGWIIDAGYLIPPEQQPKYAKDQTIEQRIGPSDFIDWQTRKSKREALK